MSYEKRLEDAVSRALSLIKEEKQVPVDLLAELDQLGVNINWLFTEAASVEGALYE